MVHELTPQHLPNDVSTSSLSLEVAINLLQTYTKTYGIRPLDSGISDQQSVGSSPGPDT